MSSQIETPQRTPAIFQVNAGSRAREEVTILVKDAVVGQEDLVIRGLPLPITEKRGRVVDPPRSRILGPGAHAAAQVDVTDNGETAPRAGGEPAHHIEVVLDKTEFEDQILGRVAGNRQLGKKQNVRAFGLRPIHGFGDLSLVGVKGADREVDLGAGDSHRKRRA